MCSFLRRGHYLSQITIIIYFAQNMLRGTRIDRDQYGDCMYLNAIYMPVFNVFNYNAFKKPKI